MTNAFIVVSRISRHIYEASCDNALSFQLGVLHRLVMRSSKQRFQSKTIPNS